MVNKIVIGTRGSELARAQARMVEEELREKWPDLAIETKIIRTGGDESHPKTGDMRQGRKGLFTAEIERALLSGKQSFSSLAHVTSFRVRFITAGPNDFR